MTITISTNPLGTKLLLTQRSTGPEGRTHTMELPFSANALPLLQQILLADLKAQSERERKLGTKADRTQQMCEHWLKTHTSAKLSCPDDVSLSDLGL